MKLGKLILCAATAALAFMPSARMETSVAIDASAVTLPAGCKSIGKRAFANCPNLIALRIPRGIEIADDAFEGCGYINIDWID